MKKRTLILATGALLVTGGTTVYASSTSEVDNQNESGYLLEENNPHRNQNERRNSGSDHHEINLTNADFENNFSNNNYGMMSSRRNKHFKSHCDFHR